MKIVPVYPNNKSNNYCLQACIKGVINYFIPKNTISDKDIIDNTDYHTDSFSWIPKSVIWLNSLGLDAHLHSPADYKEISVRGIEYLQELKSPNIFELEKQRGEYKYIEEIQSASDKMVKLGQWTKNSITVDELEQILIDEKTLAIGKTVYEWLDGKYIAGMSHFVVVVKKYSQGVWRIMDPGLPAIQDRKVNQLINNHSIFGDIIVIKSSEN